DGRPRGARRSAREGIRNPSFDELHDMPSLDDRPDVPIARVSRFWRSLHERAQAPERSPEFPPDADVLDALSRRDVLRLARAGSALVAAGCAQRPSGPVLPYGPDPPAPPAA